MSGSAEHEDDLAAALLPAFDLEAREQPGDELRAMRIATRTAAAFVKAEADTLRGSTLSAFDLERPAWRPDQQMAHRMVQAALQNKAMAPTSPPQGRRWLGMPMALALMLMSSGAVAASGFILVKVLPALSDQAPARSPKTPKKPAKRVAVLATVDAEPVQPPPREQPAADDVGEPASVPQPTPAVRAPPRQEDAAQLFVQANRHRRAAEMQQARALYLRLTQRFPSTREASLSRLALADLATTAGRHDVALGHLDRFLASANASDLVEEGLQRKARVLGAAHRVDEARATWQLLRSRFPNSVYRMEADRHLAGPGAR